MRMFCQDLRIFLGKPCFSHDFWALFFPCLSWFQIFVVNFPPGMIPIWGLDRGQDLDARAAGGPSGNLWEFPIFSTWKSPDQKTPEVKPWVLGTCWNHSNRNWSLGCDVARLDHRVFDVCFMPLDPVASDPPHSFCEGLLRWDTAVSSNISGSCEILLHGLMIVP